MSFLSDLQFKEIELLGEIQGLNAKVAGMTNCNFSNGNCEYKPFMYSGEVSAINFQLDIIRERISIEESKNSVSQSVETIQPNESIQQNQSIQPTENKNIVSIALIGLGFLMLV